MSDPHLLFSFDLALFLISFLPTVGDHIESFWGAMQWRGHTDISERANAYMQFKRLETQVRWRSVSIWAVRGIGTSI
jgi:hypothetical protein